MTSPTPNCQTVSLVTSGCCESAHASTWRLIADAWPEYARPPRLNKLKLESAIDSAGRLLGDAVMLVVEEHDALPPVHKLIDHLWNAMVPGILLYPRSSEQFASLGGRGVIAIPNSTEPHVVAATLSALADRQETIDVLHSEIRTARRFQGGLRGEMDKLHEELQLAAIVQREFLPKVLPSMPNVDVQVLFRPCGYVSGDIYDVQRLDEHHLGFFVADAVGHGVPAALMTMVLSRSITMKDVVGSEYRLIPPGEVLENLNRAMIRRHAETPRFATAVYGVIDVRDLTVTLAGAGHPPPLVLSEGRTRRIETQGGLLGVFEEDSFTEASFTLEPGEMLLIYSDGFETAFPSADADEYGRRLPTHHYLEHFTNSAEEWRDGSLRDAMRILGERLDAQAGSLHQVDDLTAMMIVPAPEDALDQLFTGASEGSAHRQPGQFLPRSGHRQH